MTDQLGMSGYLRKEDMLAAHVKDLTRQLGVARAEGFAAGLEAAAELVEGGFDRVVAEPRRNDGAPSKSDKCPHDRVMYEDCERCAVSAIRALNKTGTEQKENEK